VFALDLIENGLLDLVVNGGQLFSVPSDLVLNILSATDCGGGAGLGSALIFQQDDTSRH
jgi:hypothetical protein